MNQESFSYVLITYLYFSFQAQKLTFDCRLGKQTFVILLFVCLFSRVILPSETF